MNSPVRENSSAWLPAALSQGGAAGEWTREFCIGLRSLPYLAEHGFHDLAVVPGAFYIELARQVHRELFHRDARSLRRIEFARPVILTDEEIALTVRAEERADGSVAYELFEATADELRHTPAPQPCARLDVDAEPVASVHGAPPSKPDDFLPLETADEFYGQLRRNGNQYGPGFQTLVGISKSATQAVGRFSEAARDGNARLSPPLLDAAAQLLAAFALDRGRTFILKSIDRLAFAAQRETEAFWARAIPSETDDANLTGSVEVLDAAGARLWEFSGIALAFIDRPASAESTPAPETRLCVAATFTAEPLEDSLRFWGAHFGRNVRVEFAPYNQVFQQLLDPASAFRGNREGVNLLVLDLEDWQREERRALPPARPECFGARPRAALPNGLEIVHLNRYETDYVYQEIFEDRSYLRHGIQLADGDTVIDIGANIGLFSLFVLSQCQRPSIYAFEPSPRVFDLLQANLAAYGDSGRVHAFNRGVAEKSGSASFTFYEHSSVFSSFHPDEREDRAAVEAVVRNVLQNELSEDGVQDADVEDLTTDRLRAETIQCPLTSVSDIIRDHGITRIHLLKIDAEKSEIGILRGIAEEHWPLIEQIVMEVHDRSRAAVQAIEEQLTRRGFRCAVVEEKLLEHSGLFNIYATRRAAPIVADAQPGFSRKVDEFSRALDSFAEVTAAPLILAIAPRSSNEAALGAAEDQLLARAARHAQVRAISSQSIVARYPVRELHDAHSRQLGHIPFTPEGYAAIGTALFRAVFNLGAAPVKVIVLDCDNTLWQGLCAEDGVAGVRVTPPFQRLQEFMIEQMHAGVLLALCSKNQEADALAVFDQCADMVLRREHLAAWRINWESKADNLRALAAQLNLGVESFVFIDDNPLECAAVRAGCPDVTVLQLPAEHEKIPAFLESLWLFDRAAATREDRERSQWYRANSEREEQHAAAPTLRDFLDGLQLRIDVREATSEQLGRVAQLTVRTNQFNHTSIRRSEGEIRDLLKTGATCLVTSVSDRFGDYGLVGAIIFTTATDRFVVDTLLLSCRALGKGVEHRMVAELAARALREGKALIQLSFRATDRNEPARAFLTSLGAAANAGDFTFELSAASLAQLRYEPVETPPLAAGNRPRATERRSGFGRANFSAAMQRLGDEFTGIDSVVAAIDSSRRPAASLMESGFAGDGSTLEQSLAAIWKKVLSRTQVGLDENFFDAGGTSLKAVLVVAAIRRELKKNVSIVALFECPTIKLLAARLDDSESSAEVASAAVASAESRGRQRRNKLVKRRVA